MPVSKDKPQPMGIGSDYLRWKLGQTPPSTEISKVPLTDPEVQKRIGMLSPAQQKLILTCAQVPDTFTREEFREKFLDEARSTGVIEELGTTTYHTLYHRFGPYISLVREYTNNLNNAPSLHGNIRSYHRTHGKRSGGSRQ